MPQIEISTANGLVQRSGHGFVDAGFQEHSAGNVNLSDASATNQQRGALIHMLTADAVGNVFKLFTKDQGATKGQVKILILKAEGDPTHTFIIDNHDNTDLATLSAPGDMVICVFNGTDWIVGKALA